MAEAAAYALGRIGDARATEPLAAALNDKNSDVRVAAAQALGEIGTAAKNATPALLAASDVNEVINGKSLRDAAEEALKSIGATAELVAYRARAAVEAAASQARKESTSAVRENRSRGSSHHVCPSTRLRILRLGSHLVLPVQ
jgi:HEAT repeat protein